jgi:hypothetical protein
MKYKATQGPRYSRSIGNGNLPIANDGRTYVKLSVSLPDEGPEMSLEG